MGVRHGLCDGYWNRGRSWCGFGLQAAPAAEICMPIPAFTYMPFLIPPAAECIVAKAIRDGGIDAVIDHEAGAMLSRDTSVSTQLPDGGFLACEL